MKPKVVLLIFVSGKIVLTGAKVREEIYMAFNNIYSVLCGKFILSPGGRSGTTADIRRIQEGSLDIKSPLPMQRARRDRGRIAEAAVKV